MHACKYSRPTSLHACMLVIIIGNLFMCHRDSSTFISIFSKITDLLLGKSDGYCYDSQ